jgi:diguanylate cyclase (GGDEF)-like protein
MNGLKVKDIMSKDAVTADKKESVPDIMRKLIKHDVGAVVIVNEHLQPFGIVTQRNLLECVMANPDGYREVIAGDIACTSLVTVDPELDSSTAYMMMKINLINRMPVVDSGKVIGMITYRDITNTLKDSFEALEVSHKDLKEKMKVDFVTSVFNKGYMDGELSFFTARSNITGISFTLLLIDIDNFKHVNDTYGHICGDIILKGVAQTLVEKSRNVSIVGRFGGDEFMIIVPYSDYNSSLYMAERLRMAVEERVFIYERSEVRVTVSMGLVEWTHGVNSSQEIIRLADNCLYEAKKTGKNKVSMSGIEIMGDSQAREQNSKTVFL